MLDPTVKFRRIFAAVYTRTLGISVDALLALSPADVAASVDAPAPEGNLSPELLQLVSMLRGWSPAKVKRLIRVLKVLENATDDE